jgi:hypothetical protein
VQLYNIKMFVWWCFGGGGHDEQYSNFKNISYCSILGYDTVKSGRWVQISRKDPSHILEYLAFHIILLNSYKHKHLFDLISI